MFGDARVRFLEIFLIVMLSGADFALADDGARTSAGAADGAGTPVASPAIPEPSPVGGPPSSVVEPAGGDGGQIPGVLREIGQRQTELTILELNLKRAELQKKLRELEAPATGPQFSSAVPAPAAAPALSTVPAESGWETSPGPLVRRIHKIGDELVAMVVFPGGETKNVRSGGSIGNGLRVVEILPDAVYVGKGDRQRYALPVSSPRRGGF